MEKSVENTIVTIMGKNYKLVEVQETPNAGEKTLAVITLDTPLGKIRQIHPIFSENGERVFDIAEGVHHFEGDIFKVEYITEAEAEQIKKQSIELDPLAELLLDLFISEKD